MHRQQDSMLSRMPAFVHGAQASDDDSALLADSNVEEVTGMVMI